MEKITDKEIKAETSAWVRERLRKLNKTQTWLAEQTGIDRTELGRKIGGTRSWKPREVALVARVLKKLPPLWNKIGKELQTDNLLPLFGSVNGASWRLRGSDMAIAKAPFGPIDTEESGDQFSYFVEEGQFKDQFVACVPADADDLRQNDIILIEEQLVLEKPERANLIRASLRRVAGGAKPWSLEPYGTSELQEAVTLLDENVSLRGRVIGFYSPVRLRRDV